MMLIVALSACGTINETQRLPQANGTPPAARGSIQSLLDRPGALSPETAQMIFISAPSLLANIMAHGISGNNSFYRPRKLSDGGYLTRDGQVFVLPEDGTSRTISDSPSSILQNSSCPSQKWSNNVPPICDTTGPFRRVFSGPGGGLVEVNIAFPSAPSKMATGTRDTGYTYLEGWTAPGSANTEFGFIYAPEPNNSYRMYISGASDPKIGIDRFEAGHTITLALVSFANQPRAGDCTTRNCAEFAAFDRSGSCGITGKPEHGYVCAGGDEVNAPGWAKTCCIFARMTTIAQSANGFSDGSKFGPIGWSDATEGPYSEFGAPQWNTGGVQSWPTDKTVNVVNYTNLTKETDTISLHP